MGETFVEEVLNSKIKNKVQFIIEFQPPKLDKDFASVVDALLTYSTLPEINLEELKQQFKEKLENYRHYVIVLSDFDLEKPQDKLKLKATAYQELLEIIKQKNRDIWLHILLLDDIKQISMDSKFELFDIFLKAKVHHDKGLYEIFKLALVHKGLVLEIFQKYVVAYVLAGSYIKGKATESSDVDVYVVIDDTDVKLHTFVELKQKLYSIVTQEAMKAMMITQSKKILHPQVYTLTEFWLAMSEANPVIITFLRDGLALYDRGTFIAWKQLLIKGIIKPSREAAEIYLNMAENTIREAENKLRTILMEDVALSMVTAAQAALMDYGLLPPDPKETSVLLKKIFVENKKLLEEKYAKKLEEIVKIRKDIEHKRKETVTGKEVEEWLNIAKEFISRMKRLKTQIDAEKEKEEISYYIQEFYSLKAQLEDLYGSSIEDIFRKKFPTELQLLNKLINDIKLYRDQKLDVVDVNRLKNNIINMNRFLRYLVEGKKSELVSKYSIEIVSAGKKYDVYPTEDYIFVIGEKIDKYNYLGEKLDSFPRDKFEEIILKEINHKGKNIIDKKLINALERIFGDFQIIK
ncbi:MAG TPA: hypothetical protein EYH22_00530 [Candidatus Nanopusillus sp.]|nr:hypothetical protein [Candidatus Nanopusillus sp.]